MASDKITIRTSVSASQQKAWEYYTSPEHIINWNFADPSWHCPTASNDMRVGGRYLARMEARDGSFGFDFQATYTEVNTGENFTYEFGGRFATVQFLEANKQTQVIITFDPETENIIELQREGWQSILDNFKLYVEKNG